VKLSNAFLVGLCLVGLAACSSGGNKGGTTGTLTGGTDTGSTDSSTSQTGGGVTAAIAGLWNETTDEGADGTDVIYTQFNADGTGTSYDYLGDTFDEGDNCYDIINFTIEVLGNNQYRVGALTFGAVRQGPNLVLSGIGGSITVPPLTGVSTTDFNSCT